MTAFMQEFITYLSEQIWTYWKGSPQPYLLGLAFLACLYLAVRKKDHTAAVLCAFAALVVLVLFFPISAKILQKIIGEEIYWRTFWMLPLIPLMGYAFCAFIRLLPQEGIPAKLLRTAATIGCCALIAWTGRLHYTAGDFYKTVNAMQIPDEVYEVGELINADRTADGKADESVIVAADDHVAAYLRLYDPTILMPYGRRRQGAESSNARRLYWRIMKADKPKRLARRAHDAQCDYLVLLDNPENPKFLKTVMSRGYDYLGQVGSYTVLKENAEYAKDIS